MLLCRAAANISDCFPSNFWILVWFLGCVQACTHRGWIYWCWCISLCHLGNSCCCLCVDPSGIIYVFWLPHLLFFSLESVNVFVLQSSIDPLLAADALMGGIFISLVLRSIHPKLVRCVFKWVRDICLEQNSSYVLVNKDRVCTSFMELLSMLSGAFCVLPFLSQYWFFDFSFFLVRNHENPAESWVDRTRLISENINIHVDPHLPMLLSPGLQLVLHILLYKVDFLQFTCSAFQSLQSLLDT